MAREAALDRHVAQLVHRDDDGAHRELNVDPVENLGADRAGGRDNPAYQPRRIAQRVIGGCHVLVEHRRAGLRRDQQPGVAGLAAGHQQQGESDAFQQQDAVTAGAARDGDDGTGQSHPQRAVAVHHLGADGSAHKPEDDIDADRGADCDEPLPPGEHHHHQRHTDVQHRARFGGEYHLSRLVGDRPPLAVPTRGDLQCNEESEAHRTHRSPQHDAWLTPCSQPRAALNSLSRYLRYQFSADLS